MQFANSVIKLQHNHWYSLIIVTLAVISVLLLLYEMFYPNATPAAIARNRTIDLGIAYIFLTDFFLGFICTKTYAGKKQYFKNNWLNLVSSIPISAGVARALRLLRVLRAARVLRVVANLRFAQKRRHETF